MYKISENLTILNTGHKIGIITVVRHTTKWQPALGLAEEKLQQQTKTSSAPLYKIKVGTNLYCYFADKTIEIIVREEYAVK